MRINLKQGESLTAVLSGAVTTTNPTVLVDWQDGATRDTSLIELDGVTAVTLLSSPNAAGREVVGLSIFNVDTVAVIVTIAQLVDGVSTTLLKISLPVGSHLVVNDSGITVVDDAGQIAQGAASGSSVVGAATGTGVTAAETALTPIWNRTVLTLVDTPIVMADEAGVAGYGGLKIYDMPRGRIAVLSVSAALAAHKTSAGIDDAFDSDFSMGTVVASNNATLTSTEANLIASTAVTQASSGDTSLTADSSAPLAIDGAATPMDVYVNMVVDDGDQDITSTPANIELTGTVEIIWAYLGP